MDKVSVIVAIYNVEAYLRKCLESIIKQSYKNLEIILVDDGSQDNCPKICDEYAVRDNRIRVIHQTNQGLVTARENGFKASYGEYLSFVDGDDWLDENMYEIMVKLAKEQKADIVITGYKQGTEYSLLRKMNRVTSGRYIGTELGKLKERVIFDGHFYECGIIPAFWNKLFTRKLMDSAYKKPNKSIRMGEDVAVTYPLIANADCVVIDNEKQPYNYRTVEKSMSRSFDLLFFDRVLLLIEGLKRSLEICPEMASKLDYYVLFVSKIGIENLLSSRAKIIFVLKYKRIKDYQKKVLTYGLLNNTNWEYFDKYSRDILKMFWKGRIATMMMLYYFHKLLLRVRGEK